jgi:hypothetical protein
MYPPAIGKDTQMWGNARQKRIQNPGGVVPGGQVDVNQPLVEKIYVE